MVTCSPGCERDGEGGVGAWWEGKDTLEGAGLASDAVVEEVG